MLGQSKRIEQQFAGIVICSEMEEEMSGKRLWLKSAVIVALALAACSSERASIQFVSTPSPVLAQDSIATPLPGNLDQVTFIEDNREYTIRQLIPRDGILPIYNPNFVNATDATYDPDELVMGVSINGDTRAYPVGILRSREMVNDVVGGIPVLVTW